MSDDVTVGPEHDLAGVPPDRKADIELARLVGRCLTLAARDLGIERASEMGLEPLCGAIVERAQGGRLDPALYRLAWMFLTRH